MEAGLERTICRRPVGASGIVRLAGDGRRRLHFSRSHQSRLPRGGPSFLRHLRRDIGSLRRDTRAARVPFLVWLAYWRQRDTLGCMVAGVWFFENFLNVAHYMADARAQVLSLVSGGEHDWELILSRWGVLASDRVIARRVSILGGLACCSRVRGWSCGGIGRRPVNAWSPERLLSLSPFPLFTILRRLDSLPYHFHLLLMRHRISCETG